ncbi:uncharacterized protein J7T54_001079 [Emericellopsis cladophorae]|uniref:Mid2 domain-containing protein n=1 Tax=Emericellopsis cladophorae TaxID=2686198 RepID=A0A9Q0BDF3_9HYPO|nr:uncharacterized protein J7T54_001079 [Emericellopsis cladophorae]KAI6780771.1 hypothetical protein J7T54_001079 [Emericellopsis cladophorae]
MRPIWGLPLLIALGNAGELAKRQNESTSSSDAVSTEINIVTETTTDADPTTTDGGDSTTTEDPSSDTTVTVTRTISGGDGDTATSTRTVSTTRTTTIAVTETVFRTTTVTSSDEETATTTIYETSTEWANERRGIELAMRTVAHVDAVPTTHAPPPVVTSAAEHNPAMAQPRAHLAKRDTITVTETVTGDQGADTTVVDTVTRTAVSTATSETTVTEDVTETEQANARTTVTVTSTLTVTSSSVSTGISEATETSSNDDGDGDSSSGSGSSDDSDGLSTGAKAGIGAAVGVAGLAIIGAIIFFCWRKRRSGPKYNPDDNAFGASEVPVGAAAAAGGAAGAGAAAGPRTPDMSHTPSTNSHLTPAAAAAAAGPKPYQAPEGYRGTAMGDGRAGYAKPETYGAAYTRASGINKSPGPLSPSPVSPDTAYSRPADRTSTLQSGPDVLPEHPTAAEMDSASYAQPQELGTHNDAAASRWANPHATEIDSQPALNQSHGPVYEMPSENYR